MFWRATTKFSTLTRRVRLLSVCRFSWRLSDEGRMMSYKTTYDNLAHLLKHDCSFLLKSGQKHPSSLAGIQKVFRSVKRNFSTMFLMFPKIRFFFIWWIELTIFWWRADRRVVYRTIHIYTGVYVNFNSIIFYRKLHGWTIQHFLSIWYKIWCAFPLFQTSLK